MKRVGLVTYWYPPRQAAGALRAASLARYLPAFGWQPVVVTVRPRNSLHVVPGDDAGTHAPAPALATTDRAWHALAASAVEALGGRAALDDLKTENVLAGRRPHARAAHWVYRQWLSFPDDAWPWLADRRAVTRTFAAHDVDAIVSTAPPPTAHLVAATAAVRLGVPWVADYRDPWSQRSAWRRASPLARAERYLERRTLAAAAHVVAVSDPGAARLRQLLGRPVTVVPNGFDPADRTAAVAAPVPIDPACFSIAHTGTLTHGSRDPDLVFAALDALIRRGTVRLEALEVWFIGRHLEVSRRAAARWPALAPAIRHIGAVPRRVALDAQRRATVLLALGSPAPAFDGDVPTKVFEYLDAGRPVLALASPSSAVAALLAETRGGSVAGTVDDITAALARWHAEWQRHGRAGVAGDPDAIARYERRRLAGEFAAVLDRLYYGLCAEGRRSRRGP